MPKQTAPADSVFVAITMDSGEPLRIMQFLTCGRGSDLPSGAVWDRTREGWWTREPSPSTIITEVARSCPPFGPDGTPLPRYLRFRVVTFEDIPTDRTFRDALVDDGKALVHDSKKIRAIRSERAARTKGAR
jgi:hypothetical protein